MSLKMYKCSTSVSVETLSTAKNNTWAHLKNTYGGEGTSWGKCRDRQTLFIQRNRQKHNPGDAESSQEESITHIIHLSLLIKYHYLSLTTSDCYVTAVFKKISEVMLKWFTAVVYHKIIIIF